MIKQNIKLKQFTSSNKLKVFLVDVDGKHQLYFADIEDTSQIDSTKKYNLGCAYDLKNQHFIHALYPIDTVTIQTTTKSSTVHGTIEDFMKLYIPTFKSSDVIDIQQVGSFTYILTKPTSAGYKFKYDSGYEIQETLKTYLYNPAVSTDLSSGTPYKNMLSCNMDGKEGYENMTLQNIFAETFSIDDFEYNYLIEIPNDYLYNFYESGSILGDGINTKRHLSYDYNMDVIQDNEKTVKISKVRNYTSIRKCGETTYMNYSCPFTYEISMLLSNDVPMPLSNDLSCYATYDNAIQNLINLSTTNILSVQDDERYQQFDKMFSKVETIESVNRFSGVQHKSNMYSIDIVDSGITKLSASQIETIKNDVDNNLREILKSITPVNTQFIGIRWQGI